MLKSERKQVILETVIRDKFVSLPCKTICAQTTKAAYCMFPAKFRNHV